jgi:hypothetical protein
VRDEKDFLHDVVQIRSLNPHPDQERSDESGVLAEQVGRGQVAFSLQCGGIS